MELPRFTKLSKGYILYLYLSTGEFAFNTYLYLRCLSYDGGKHVLKVIHQGCGGDHVGFRVVVQKALRAGYFWPTMVRNVKELVMKCEKCQRHGSLIHVPAEELGALYSTCPFAK